jgi:superfamily II DNA or RNA helicase
MRINETLGPAAGPKRRAGQFVGSPRPAEDLAPGLHAHLVPHGESYRVGLWFESHKAGPTAFRDLKLGKYEREHPACASDHRLAAQLGLLPEAEHVSFWVHQPRLGSGYPVALPGPLAAWDTARFKVGGRTVNRDWYEVAGWLLSPQQSLQPLLGLLRDWHARFGEAFLAPQVLGLRDVLSRLLQLWAEGPLLPVVAVSERAGRQASGTAAGKLGWAPPITLADLQRLWGALREAPHLLARDAAGIMNDDDLAAHKRYPRRFAYFAVELFAAINVQRPRWPKGWSEKALLAALLDDSCAVRQLHDAYGSCLYPHHPVMQAVSLPQQHLHAEISTSDADADADTARPFRLRLGLVHDKRKGARGKGAKSEASKVLRLSEILADESLHDAWIEKHNSLWQRPASVFYRDWQGLLRMQASLLTRPELLGAGETALSSAEATHVLDQAGIIGSSYEWSAFAKREGFYGVKNKRQFTQFTSSTVQTGALKVRVRWQPEVAPDAVGSDLWNLQRFTPHVSLAVGDTDLAIDAAEMLLRDSTGPLLQVNGQTLTREVVVTAVEAAIARRKVVRKLGEEGVVTWAQLTAAEDSWANDDESLYETQFAQHWQAFLDSLRGAQVELRPPAPAFVGDLRPYQQRGYAWLAFLVAHGLGGCLADDMGLGKTVQILALIASLRADQLPALVVAPTSVVNNWRREAARFVPTLPVYVHLGSGRPQGAALAEQIDGAKIVITSYATARLDGAAMADRTWGLVVADEAQNLKNAVAQQTRAIKAIPARARLALSGTPVENRLGDLWSIFDFVLPGLLGGPTRFAKALATPIRNGSSVATKRLQERIGPFLLRRTKRDPAIALDLPAKQEQVVECKLSREQVALYQAMSEAALHGLVDKHGLERKAHVLQALMHLKQICDHPEVFVQERPQSLKERSGKLTRLIELLEDLFLEGQAVLVFTQFIAMGKILQRAIEQTFDFEPPFFHGSLTPAERADMIDAFQDPEGPPLLLLSLKAGGTGLNLTRATAVVHFDRWWNPAVEDQATDRAHRIGQVQKVNVYKFVTRGTLEERIDTLLEHKREMADRVLGAGQERWLTEMSDEQLQAFLRLDSEASAEEQEQ